MEGRGDGGEALEVVCKMSGIGGGGYSFFMETFSVHKMSRQSVFEVGLGAANVEFPGQVTLNLVDPDGVSADVIVSTACGVAGVAVACKGVKVKGGDVLGQFAGEVSI